MMITHKLTMDLTHREPLSPIEVVQDDKYSRNLELRLFAGGKAVDLPEDCAVLIRCQKSDGTGSCYDTLPDGSKAWHTAGHVLTVALAPQVLTTAGRTELMVTILAGQAEISTFCIPLAVHACPKFMAKSSNYINTTCFIPQPTAAELGQYLAVTGRTDGGRIVTVEGVDPPKSAYALAQEAGYQGSEADFSKNLAAEIPTKTSQLTNDSRFITRTASDLAYYYTMGQVDELMEDLTPDLTGYATESWVSGQLAFYQAAGDYALRSELPKVPVQSVNGKTGAVALTASNVGARPATWVPTAAEVGAVSTSQTLTLTGIDEDGVSHSWTVYGVAQ